MLSKALQLAAAGNSSADEIVADYRDADEYSHDAFDTVDATSTVSAVAISRDGTKFYHIDASENLEQYTLSTPYDITSHGSQVATKNLSTLSSSANTHASSLFFKPDGTRLFVSDATDQAVYEYSLSTAWSISTLSYVGSHSISDNVGGGFRGIYFSPDGTKMFGVSNTYRRVYRWDLSTAWDISTETYHSSSPSTRTQFNERTPVAFWASDDGTIGYLLGNYLDAIWSFDLDPAYDMSDVSLAGMNSSFSVRSQESLPQDMCFSADGRYIYVGGANDQGVDVWDRGAS